jgi:hypothetical protein
MIKPVVPTPPVSTAPGPSVSNGLGTASASSIAKTSQTFGIVVVNDAQQSLVPSGVIQRGVAQRGVPENSGSQQSTPQHTIFQFGALQHGYPGLYSDQQFTAPPGFFPSGSDSRYGQNTQNMQNHGTAPGFYGMHTSSHESNNSRPRSSFSNNSPQQYQNSLSLFQAAPAHVDSNSQRSSPVPSLQIPRPPPGDGPPPAKQARMNGCISKDSS